MKPNALIRAAVAAMTPDDGEPMAVLANLLADIGARAVTANKWLLAIVLSLCDKFRDRNTIETDPDAEMTMLACLVTGAHCNEFDIVRPEDMTVLGARELLEALRHEKVTLADGVSTYTKTIWDMRAQAGPVVPPATINDPCDTMMHELHAPVKLLDTILATSGALRARAAHQRACAGRSEARRIVAARIRRLGARRAALDKLIHSADVLRNDGPVNVVRAELADAIADLEDAT